MQKCCSQLQDPDCELFEDASRLTAGLFLRRCCTGEVTGDWPAVVGRFELGDEQRGVGGRLQRCLGSCTTLACSGTGAVRGAEGGLWGAGGLCGAGGLLGSGPRSPTRMRAVMSACPASAGSAGGSAGASGRGGAGDSGSGAGDRGSTVGAKKRVGSRPASAKSLSSRLLSSAWPSNSVRISSFP